MPSSVKLIISKEVIFNVLKRKRYDFIALEGPNGLKQRLLELASELTQKFKIKCVVFGRPCYGACDVGDLQAREIGVKALFHVGHAIFLSSTKLPTYYVPVHVEVCNEETFFQLVSEFSREYRRVGLTTSFPYVKLMYKVKKWLAKAGVKVFTARGVKARLEGEVLGCDVSAAKSIENLVEAFLHVGDGLFHPLGVALSVSKPVYRLSPEENAIYPVNEVVERFRAKRYAYSLKLVEAEKVGVIVSTKRGQVNLKESLYIYRILKKTGKKVYLLAVDEVSPETLLNFPDIECFVNTACPRLSIDDVDRFKRPLILPQEVREIFGDKEGLNKKGA